MASLDVRIVTLDNVISVLVMIFLLDQVVLLNEIIGIILMVLELNVEMVKLSIASSLIMFASLCESALGVVTFIVFVVETVVISSGRKFGIVKCFVVIADSLHVFWGICDVRIMR